MSDSRRVTCEEFVRELPSFLDGELATADLARLGSHLDECARCLAKYRFERSLIDSLRSRLATVDLPDGLTRRIAAALREAGGPP